MSPLRMAVIGAGALGRHHARILAGMDNVELTAVVDPNDEAASRVAAATDSVACADFHEVIDRVDAVSIVVPTVLHLEISREFIQRGIPVLVEKPLAADLDEARQLVHLARTHGSLLQVGHVERFNPAMSVARRLVTGPRYIRAERVSPFTFRSTDIGAIHDLMIHDIDLALAFTGSDVVDVQAFGVTLFGGHEDLVQARLTFESGCIADLVAGRTFPSARRSLQVWSDSGCVNVDLQERTVTSYQTTDALRSSPPLAQLAAHPGADIETLKQDVLTKLIRMQQHDVLDSDALTDELTEFVACIRHNGRPQVCGETALKAMQVAERVQNSVNTHQWDGGSPNGRVGSRLERLEPSPHAA